jgi:formate dehydrogenase major subunit
LQDQAAAVGLRDVRYGYEGADHLGAPVDTSNPYFDFDPEQMHRLLALRARLR